MPACIRIEYRVPAGMFRGFDKDELDNYLSIRK
jgi:hypothetical protein